MRWLTLVFIISSPIYSVLSEEANDNAPSLRIIPKSAIIDVGLQRAIYCEGNNLPDPQTFQWISPKGQILAPRSNKNTRVYLEKNQLKGKTNTWMVALVIKTATEDDSGNWTCKANDLSDTIDVFVGVRMNLTNKEDPLQADNGKSVQLDCYGNGNPLPTAQWYKNGVQITSDQVKYKINTIKWDHNTRLEIMNLNHEDSGQYVCKLTQKRFMTFAERKYVLSVRHKPIIFDREGNEITSASVQEDYAILNEIKVLRCSSKAYPPPKYYWYKIIGNFEKPIDGDKNYGTEPTTPMSVKDDPSGEYSELTLMMRNASFLGQYKCKASNEQGTKQVVFDVTVGEKPATPTTISIESANYTEVVLNVTCSNCTFKTDEEKWTGLTVTGYHFQFVDYRENFLPDWESESKIDIEVNIEESNDTLFVVGPLPNSTKLHVRVRSRNQAGYSDWLADSLVVETSKAVKLAATFIIILIAYFFIAN